MLAAQSRKQFPKENEYTGATVNGLRDELSQQSRVLVLALSGAALCVLLIVCANLANLLLARALGRRQELAVRTAIGAGRERLIRQLATESVVLAALGGALGVLLAVVARPDALATRAGGAADVRHARHRSAGPRVRRGADARHRARVRARADAADRQRTPSVQGLREGSRAIGGAEGETARRARRRRGHRVGRAARRHGTAACARCGTFRARDPGFRAEGVLTLRTDLPSAKYAVTARRAEFYNRVLDQVRALPGVTNAAYISGLPMVWGGGIWPVGINGVELERRADNTASMRFVTPGFFATLDVPVRRGRDVSDRDTMTTQFVAVVSESFVKRYWPGQDAIGRTFNFATKDRTIVGVVGDIRVRGLERDSEPQVYLPYKQVADGWFWGYTPKELVIHAHHAARASSCRPFAASSGARIRSSRSPTCGR